MKNIDDELKLKLVQETATMHWSALQRYFASGMVLYVAVDLDLVDIACELSRDNKDTLKPLIDNNRLAPVTDEQALSWFAEDVQLWTLVVRPWVLVQIAKG